MGQVSINIKVEHLDEIKSAFARFPEIVGPYLRDASMRSALFLEGESKKRSPVDTGRLRSSIATSLGVKNNGLTSIISTNVFYAVYVHDGTKSKKGKVLMKARPFMKNAVEENKDQLSKIYQEQINKGLQAIKNMAQ